MRKWIKLYTEILDDHKMESMSDHLFRIAVKLFAVAGRVDRDGLLGTLEQVALYLRQDDKTTLKDMQELEKVRVTCNKNGIWRLKNFKTRNGKSLSDSKSAIYERVKKHRENKAKTEELKRESNESVTALHIESNESVTPLDKKRIEENRRESIGAEKPRREPTQDQIELARLETLFCELTGLPKPPRSTEKEKRASGEMWWQPLRHISQQSNGQSDKVLKIAVQKMRKDNLTIYSPKSIEKVAIATIAELPRTFNPKPPEDPFAALERYANEKDR